MSGYKHGGWIQNRHLYTVWSCMLSRCKNPISGTLYDNDTDGWFDWLKQEATDGT